MIARLRGKIGKGDGGDVIVDCGGVGYRVQVPLSAWEQLPENAEGTLWISTYVREDRLDLYGFPDRVTRALFERFITLPGIGPKLGLELCSVPRSVLVQAVATEDASALTSVKGIGRKTAEKLIVELKDIAEKMPDAFSLEGDAADRMPAKFDRDAIAALAQLGYASQDILRVLGTLPKDLKTTEDRVTAALRTL